MTTFSTSSRRATSPAARPSGTDADLTRTYADTAPTDGGPAQPGGRSGPPEAGRKANGPRPAAPSPLVSLSRHKRPAALLTLLLAVLAVLVGVVRDPTYTAEARLAVGAGELSTIAIPGFPTASEDLASSYSRWVTTVGVGEMTLPEGTMSMAASPIPESNVIRIEATSKNESTATEAADAAAAQLIEEVQQVKTDNDPQQILADVNDGTAEIIRLTEDVRLANQEYLTSRGGQQDGAVDQRLVDGRFDAYVAAEIELNAAELEFNALQDRYRRIVSDRNTEADLRTIGQGAMVSGDDEASYIQRMALLGVGAGAMLSLAGATLYERRRAAAPRS